MWTFNLKQGQHLYFTSDTHYDHVNICKGTTKWDLSKRPGSIRDFDTLDKMNNTIVNNINLKVHEDDILIHLGDWSFGGIDKIAEFRNRLICKNIYLVLGNHDHHIERNKENTRSYFVDVQHYTEIKIKWETNKTITSFDAVCMHFPICSWNNMSKGKFHLHGHVHLPPVYKVGQGRSLDVGVDGNNMEPYHFRDIINILKNQPISSLSLKKDHHEHGE